MQHDDISGSRSKKPKQVEVQKDIMKVNDIEGALPRQPKVREQAYDSFLYKDVYAKDWKSKRCTNPLQPEYQVRDSITKGDFIKQGETQVNSAYGAVEGSNPKSLPDPVQGTRNLQTSDIQGAEANSKRIGAFSHYKRQDEPKALTQNEDIPGSKCGTLKHAIQTDRNTNPLQPTYQVPGNSEIA